jgi:hypothetical protein
MRSGRMPVHADAAKVRRRNRKKATFLSANQIDEQAAARIIEAEHLPPGEARDSALRNAAHLRAYASMKRLLEPQRGLGRRNGVSDGGN